jgi:dihydroorotase
MSRDMCIRAGMVFFPEINAIKRKDILISDGKVAGIYDEAEQKDSITIIDAQNKLVTPGLIDFHMHAFRYGHFLSLDTEELSPRSGTTTFVDGGSAGSTNFLAFREYVIRPAKANILAFLNISAIGQSTDGIEGLDFHDYDDDRLLHIPSALEIIEKNRQLIVGVKVRAYTGLKSTICLKKARELADIVHLPIMVHLAPPPLEFDEILPFLREGDIITHPYHGGSKTILDDRGQVRPEYWEARRRGIEVDLGLDRFHGDLTIMKAAIDQGFAPDYISSDLASVNIHSVTFDLPTTVSKAICLGLSLTEALQKCTRAPAVKMGKEKEIGDITPGIFADVAIFDMLSGEHEFEDFFGHKILAKERLMPFMTIRKGDILQPTTRQTETLDCLRKGNPWLHYDG